MTRSAFFAHLANNCHAIVDVAEQDTVWKKAITLFAPPTAFCAFCACGSALCVLGVPFFVEFAYLRFVCHGFPFSSLAFAPRVLRWVNVVSIVVQQLVNIGLALVHIWVNIESELGQRWFDSGSNVVQT